MKLITTLSLILAFIWSCSNPENTSTKTHSKTEITEEAKTIIKDSTSAISEKMMDTNVEKEVIIDNDMPVEDKIEAVKKQMEDMPEDMKKEVEERMEEIKKDNANLSDKEINEKISEDLKKMGMEVEKEVTKEVKEEEMPKPLSEIDHSSWHTLLQKYVASSGKVNYKGFKSEKSNLEAYLKHLNDNYDLVQTLGSSHKLAYYINAYNAYTIKLIVDNYPVSSITKLKGGKPWDVKWIKLGGKTLSLNDIEHNIIRKKFNEPRIHFAVNCASVSCPRLSNRAFTHKNLYGELSRMSKLFINNKSKNQITESSIKISEIFNWYKSDFEKKGTLIEFLNKYSDTKINADANISHLPYDWNLNE